MNHTAKPLMQQLAEAETTRDDALRAQRRAQDSLLEARRRAEQLMLYRQEYENGWGAAARCSGDAGLLAHHHAFIDRLCREIDAQLALCKAAAGTLVSTRAALRNRESHVMSVPRGDRAQAQAGAAPGPHRPLGRALRRGPGSLPANPVCADHGHAPGTRSGVSTRSREPTHA